MEIYVTNSLFRYFLFFFWFSNMILSDALILPISQLDHPVYVANFNKSINRDLNDKNKTQQPYISLFYVVI